VEIRSGGEKPSLGDDESSSGSQPIPWGGERIRPGGDRPSSGSDPVRWGDDRRSWGMDRPSLGSHPFRWGSVELTRFRGLFILWDPGVCDAKK
jgi:hypothetical protein